MAEAAGGGIGFASTIQPYFTQLDRDQMMDSNHTGGFTLDLWSASDVQQNFAMISRVIQRGQMPPAGNPPDTDGPWPQAKIQQFLTDFNAWKTAGFPPDTRRGHRPTVTANSKEDVCERPASQGWCVSSSARAR